MQSTVTRRNESDDADKIVHFKARIFVERAKPLMPDEMNNIMTCLFLLESLPEFPQKSIELVWHSQAEFMCTSGSGELPLITCDIGTKRILERSVPDASSRSSASSPYLFIIEGWKSLERFIATVLSSPTKLDHFVLNDSHRSVPTIFSQKALKMAAFNAFSAPPQHHPATDASPSPSSLLSSLSLQMHFDRLTCNLERILCFKLWGENSAERTKGVMRVGELLEQAFAHRFAWPLDRILLAKRKSTMRNLLEKCDWLDRTEREIDMQFEEVISICADLISGRICLLGDEDCAETKSSSSVYDSVTASSSWPLKFISQMEQPGQMDAVLYGYLAVILRSVTWSSCAIPLFDEFERIVRRNTIIVDWLARIDSQWPQLAIFLQQLEQRDTTADPVHISFC